MKKIFYILLTLVLAAGCHFLDFDETSGVYTREDRYNTYSNIQKMLTNIYGYMPYQDISDVGSALRDCGSDDAEYGDPDGTVQTFTNGNWSPVTTVDDKWNLYYGIRAANEFLESMKTVDLSRYEHMAGYAEQMEHLNLYPYQARVLRAYFFFELARRYGDIAMPLSMLTVEEANAIGKTKFDDVVAFIAEECDTCAKYLPDSYLTMLDQEYGRVTRGFAKGLKTKALLYAASPLFNPNEDVEKWRKAGKAAKDIMDLKNSNDLPLFSLDPDETCNSFNSPEVIFQIMRSESQSFERRNFPVRFTMGERGTSMSETYPTQNLVDAFQTLAGYDVTLDETGWHSADPAFDPAKPYDGRDIRFARAVLADGMAFKGSVIETYEGGLDYHATRQEHGTPTGYFLNRFIQPETDFTPEASVKKQHSFIVYRYAEVLLTYAEAVNEILGPDGTDADFPISARAALNQVRANAGMPDVTVAGKDAFRTALQREWRVEFAFEDHRFWDVRRWNIGQNTQTQVDGVEIVKSGNQFTYSRKVVESRNWSSKMNLYPIPQSETFNNPNLTQNTGW